MKFYHVAPASYEIGTPLLCWDELEARGYDLTWKYDGEPVDTDVVCLFREDQLDEAQEFVEVFLPDGRILEINIDDDDDMLRLTKVSEGYTAVYKSIPAKYISELK